MTKKVRRVPLSRQNCANAATTSVLVPSSMVKASWFPSPGRRVMTPVGADPRLRHRPAAGVGECGRGTGHRREHADRGRLQELRAGAAFFDRTGVPRVRGESCWAARRAPPRQHPPPGWPGPAGRPAAAPAQHALTAPSTARPIAARQPSDDAAQRYLRLRHRHRQQRPQRAAHHHSAITPHAIIGAIVLGGRRVGVEIAVIVNRVEIDRVAEVGVAWVFPAIVDTAVAVATVMLVALGDKPTRRTRTASMPANARPQAANRVAQSTKPPVSPVRSAQIPYKDSARQPGKSLAPVQLDAAQSVPYERTASR